MAEINKFVTPESLVRPETQMAAERDSERIDQIKETAINQASKFDEKFLKAADVGGTELFGFGSNFEGQYLKSLVPLKLMFDVRHRVFDVLRKSGEAYEKSLEGAQGGGSEFTKLDLAILKSSRKDTMDSIEKKGRGAKQSLTAALMYENILATTTQNFENQWNAAKENAENYFETRRWWEKGTTFWRKTRFNSFSKRFEASLERRRNKTQVAIDIIKNKKRFEAERTETQIRRAFGNANDSKKERLWATIRSVIKNPEKNTTDTTLKLFGVPTKNKVDFLEAIKNMRYADAVVQTRRSEALGLDAKKKLENFQMRENALDHDEATGKINTNYKKLVEDLKSVPVTAYENQVKTHELAEEIESDLVNQKINLLEQVYGNVDKPEITSAEKMIYFAQFLGTNKDAFKNLHITTKRKLLKYISDIDKNTKDPSDNYEKTKIIEELDNGLEKTLENFKKLVGTTDGMKPNLRSVKRFLTPERLAAQNFNNFLQGFEFDLFKKKFSDDELKKLRVELWEKETWGNLMENVSEVFANFDETERAFEKKKEQLSEKEKESFERKWKEIKETKQKIEEQVKKWDEERKKFQELRKNIPNRWHKKSIFKDSPVGTATDIGEDWIKWLEDEIQEHEKEKSGLHATVYNYLSSDTPKDSDLTAIPDDLTRTFAHHVRTLRDEVKKYEKERTPSEIGLNRKADLAKTEYEEAYQTFKTVDLNRSALEKILAEAKRAESTPEKQREPSIQSLIETTFPQWQHKTNLELVTIINTKISEIDVLKQKYEAKEAAYLVAQEAARKDNELRTNIENIVKNLETADAELKKRIEILSARQDEKIEKIKKQIESISTELTQINEFPFSNPEEFLVDFARIDKIKIEKTPYSANTLAPDFNTRIHKAIKKEFYQDLEADYLGFLEKNTKEQWDILQNTPEGAQINLSFCDATILEGIQMPQDLKDKQITKGGPAGSDTRLRVIKKDASYVQLEDNEKIYIINGPSATDRKANQNIAVYNKVNANEEAVTGYGTETESKKYVIPHSNPNQIGIILSMTVN